MLDNKNETYNNSSIYSNFNNFIFSKRMTKEQKTSYQFITGIIVTLIGLILLFCGLFIPPMGIIDWSVLTAFGEIATFSGCLIGIDYTYKIKELKSNK